MSDNPVPAAAYIRMSKEDQKYSTQNQMAVIANYALLNNYEIVQTFSDPGISGLDLKHRPGLKALLDAVKAGRPAFQSVLVLDVSRWGRFQDIDESAHYEFICRMAGVQVQYCGEMFMNDNSPYSSLVKAIKRIMAAEYSRELGVKVFNGQARLAALGFKQGGSASIGLRRLMLDEHGKPKQLLKQGQMKNLVKDRVVLVPGPQREQRFVLNLFQSILEGRSIKTITKELRANRRFNRNWTTTSVYTILHNPQYMGTYAYNRTSERLKSKLQRNPAERWVCCVGAIKPIVPAELWKGVQQTLADRNTWKLSDNDFLDQLKALWKDRGFISARLVDSSRKTPSTSAYARRFGTFGNALRRIGCNQFKNQDASKRRYLRDLRQRSWQALKANVIESGLHLRWRSSTKYQIHISGVPVLNFVLARPIERKNGCPTWVISPPQPAPIGRSIIGVLSHDATEIREFVISDRLRKTVVRKMCLPLPKLAAIALARFRFTPEFVSALGRARLL